VKLPSWLRVGLGLESTGIRGVRLGSDGRTLHTLAYDVSMPDSGDMVMSWHHRAVDLVNGWVGSERFGVAPDDDAERIALEETFWAWVEARQKAGPLCALPPSPLRWEWHNPAESDTEKPTRPPMQEGLRIHRNQRMRDGYVDWVREGRVARRHTIAGATIAGGGDVELVWVGSGHHADQIVVVAGALRPSVLVLNTQTGQRMLHVRV
jgi:hypothetical protein